MVRRIKAHITGIVQGIGFRPFVYNLARKRNIFGYILNSSAGVEIDAEGEADQVELFFDEIQHNNLPLAHIISISKNDLPVNNYKKFEIQTSQSSSDKIALIPPDICVCNDCLEEMNDPTDRRYRYPFINCTNCGPRYTIIDDIPYDRPKTSMRVFEMCEDCLKEYHDPENRRFHAQPNACPVCGPQITLFDARQTIVKCHDPILQTIELLKSGKIIAIKGLGGFHLTVNAEDDDAVALLKKRKNREEKPLALMSFGLERIRKYAIVSDEVEKLLLSHQRPIVLLQKKEPNSIAPSVAVNNSNFGVMLPYTPLHYLLLENDLLALVMTSGNVSDEPICIDNDDAFVRLAQIADYFLMHNRDIYLRSDDSIVRRMNSETRQIRRSRGYAPMPIFLHKKNPQILACGAELKNTICLTKDDRAFMSQHVGDLKNQEAYNFFQLTIDHLKRILDIEPSVIAFDLHPDYLCTQYALEQEKIPKIGVQHHHAHIASCMAEYGLDGPVIGLSFDGTGYGTDGKIWGGEFLLVEGAGFSRLAHLAYTPMPGGDTAIKEPWRMALSYLFSIFGDDVLNLKLPLFQQIERNKIDVILQMIKKKINCPETSSLGRLFDGIASILGICQRSTYEGQAAITLEMVLNSGEKSGTYSFEWEKKNGIYIISPDAIIKGIVTDLSEKKSPGFISWKFHRTWIQLCKALCLHLRADTGANRIVLSGGVFQNATLLTGLTEVLTKQNFEVYSHRLAPTNDGGIALGQAIVAAETFRK